MPQLKPTRGICLNRSHPLSRGLVGLWLFNEGSGGQVFDLSGNGNHGIEQTDSIWYPGKYGPTRYFSGDDYINCGSNDVLGFGGLVEFTIIIRGLATNVDNQQQLIDRLSLASPWPGYHVYIKWNDVYVGLDDGVDSVTVNTTSNCLSNNTWFDLAIVAHNGNLKFYVDGIDLNEDGDISIIDTIEASANFIIGATQGGGTNLTGQIDFMPVYNRALSLNEIALLCREPFCMFEGMISPAYFFVEISSSSSSSESSSSSSSSESSSSSSSSESSSSSSLSFSSSSSSFSSSSSSSSLSSSSSSSSLSFSSSSSSESFSSSSSSLSSSSSSSSLSSSSSSSLSSSSSSLSSSSSSSSSLSSSSQSSSSISSHSSSSSSSSSWMVSPNAADRALQMAVDSTMESLSYDTITYWPRVGGSRTIKAIIDYPGPEAISGLAGGSRPILDVYIENNSIRGITSAEVDTGGDKLDLPMRYNLAAKRMRIIKIAAQDKSILHVQAQ